MKDGKGKKLRRKAARGIGRKTRGPGLWRPRQELSVSVALGSYIN